ncbi:hypothetical protein D3C75_763600 [compost metagenome]
MQELLGVDSCDQFRIPFTNKGNFPFRSPDRIIIFSLSQQIAGEFLKLLMVVKAGGQLTGQRLVPHKAALLTSLDGKIVVLSRFIVPACDSGPFGFHQHLMLPEGLRGMSGPFTDPAVFLAHSGLGLSFPVCA